MAASNPYLAKPLSNRGASLTGQLGTSTVLFSVAILFVLDALTFLISISLSHRFFPTGSDSHETVVSRFFFDLAAGMLFAFLLHRNTFSSFSSSPIHETAGSILTSTQIFAAFLLFRCLQGYSLSPSLLCSLTWMPILLLFQRKSIHAVLSRWTSLPVWTNPSQTTSQTAHSQSLNIRKQLAGIATEAGTEIALKESLQATHLRLLSSNVIRLWCYTWTKRGIDIALSLLLLVLLSPLLALIAIGIRIGSPGPVLFVQKRIGRNGHPFRIYKFRSMTVRSCRYERSPESSDDPRITRFGRLLRRTSLDELPQLMNVLRGEMSLVGPRPEMPFVVRQYNETQRLRLCVLPGITGLWQLSPDRAYPIHHNLHHDIGYIRDRCLSLDLAILLHTLFFAMRGGI